jgi:tetratricopeptide (TPR) repeat protein
MGRQVPEAGAQALTAIKEAERLIQAGSLEPASAVLEHAIEQDATLEALYLLAATYCELGKNDAALRHASAAVDQDPSSAPARDMLAKVNLALAHYDSALTEYIVLAALCREQSPKPPDQLSIPAHYALHNIEQLEHILTVAKREKPTSGSVLTEELQALSRGLSDLINEANGEAPWLTLPGRSSQILADPPYVRVTEERLPQYVNTAVDYASIQQGVVNGQKVQVIDNFLTPQALEQVQRFCLESTVWRHPYKFGYVGAFPQDGFASTSLFAIAEEFLAALGAAFEGIQFAQWWGFVYNANLPGTDIHGDDADFSLNLWITPDSANLDPDSGGLVVWDKKAPSDWSFDDYNSGGDRVRQYLDEHNAEPHVIPHRANRAVLFEGHLFHRTDGFAFAPGFENRRRSLTFLFRRTKG